MLRMPLHLLIRRPVHRLYRPYRPVSARIDCLCTVSWWPAAAATGRPRADPPSLAPADYEQTPSQVNVCLDGVETELTVEKRTSSILEVRTTRRLSSRLSQA